MLTELLNDPMMIYVQLDINNVEVENFNMLPFT